jgi:uncharacterized Fe-S cluster-containing protein
VARLKRKRNTRVTIARKDNIKKIYELLPKLNCGLCGYDNCGQFARAVAEGRASPSGCRQDPWLGYRLSEGFSPTPRAFKKEIRELLKKADDILIRIQDLKARR